MVDGAAGPLAIGPPPRPPCVWDLHVAIQDAMGWLDYHLHEFRLPDADEQRLVSIGIPTDDDPEDRPVIPGWEVPLSRFFETRGWHAPHASYAYDFGDDWEHVLVHEGMESAEPSLRYPRCVSGAPRGLRWGARVRGVPRRDLCC